jgi:hypothetical protein
VTPEVSHIITGLSWTHSNWDNDGISTWQFQLTNVNNSHIPNLFYNGSCTHVSLLNEPMCLINVTSLLSDDTVAGFLLLLWRHPCTATDRCSKNSFTSNKRCIYNTTAI